MNFEVADLLIDDAASTLAAIGEVEAGATSDRLAVVNRRGNVDMDKVHTPEELGNPAQDSRALRRTLGQFATGVTIVTSGDAEHPAGLTVNSFASVSLSPPLVLCSIARSSRSFGAFQRARHLAINVLASDQVELASKFAGSAEDKFHSVAWKAGIGGVPILDGVAATLECRIQQLLDGGDHVIYICEVLQYARYERPLLLYAGGRFGLVLEYPSEPSEPAPASAPDGGKSLLQLLWEAWSQVSGKFQADRDAEGMSIDQGRVLSHVERYPGAPLAFIASHSFLGKRVTEDALSALTSDGLLAPLADGSFAVTQAGRKRLDSLRQRAAAFEAKQLDAIAPDEVRVLRRLLTMLGDRPG